MSRLPRGSKLPQQYVEALTEAPTVGVDVEIFAGVLRAVVPTQPSDSLLIADGPGTFTIIGLTVDARLDRGAVLEARNGAHFQPMCVFLTSGQYDIKQRYS